MDYFVECLWWSLSLHDFSTYVLYLQGDCLFMISLYILYLQLLYELEKPFLLCSWYVYATGVLTLAVILPGLNNLLKQNNVFEYYIFQEKLKWA